MKKPQQNTLFGKPKQKIGYRKDYKKAINFFPTKGKTPELILETIEEQFDRHDFYAMTSGGKDSITLTNWLAESGKLKQVVHIDTGVGLRMTTDFVRDYCQEMGWNLEIITPRVSKIYASFVLEYGFPGPAGHKYIMGYLKLSAMRDFALSVNKNNHCLVSGIRKFESARRTGNFPEPIHVNGSLWFVCPFFYRSNESIYRDYLSHGLRKSPAYDHGLGTSGECMCGSFATFDEKMLIKKLDPHLADYIEWLEDGVQRFGTDIAKKRPKWGGNVKMSEIEEQKFINQFIDEGLDKSEGIVCGSECGPGTLRGETDF